MEEKKCSYHLGVPVESLNESERWQPGIMIPQAMKAKIQDAESKDPGGFIAGPWAQRASYARHFSEHNRGGMNWKAKELQNATEGKE